MGAVGDEAGDIFAVPDHAKARLVGTLHIMGESIFEVAREGRRERQLAVEIERETAGYRIGHHGEYVIVPMHQPVEGTASDLPHEHDIARGVRDYDRPTREAYILWPGEETPHVLLAEVSLVVETSSFYPMHRGIIASDTSAREYPAE
jgi:hypothetical protein